MRNSFGATAVAPYAVRAHDGAPVATPLEWHELAHKKLTAQAFTMTTIVKRIEEKGISGRICTKNLSHLKKLKGF